MPSGVNRGTRAPPEPSGGAAFGPATRRRGATVLPSPAIVLIGALAGCQTHPGQQHHCVPKPGMTTDELAECGCLLHDQGGLALAPVSRSQASGETRSVIIVNYICPLGREGIAMVSVINGVADRVYR